MAEEVNKSAAPSSPQGAPAPGTPAGNAAPAGAAPGMPAAAPGMPAGNAMPNMMVPPHVAAMMPRPYPNPQQMFQPVGMAYAMRMQQMEQGPAPTQGKQKPKA